MSDIIYNTFIYTVGTRRGNLPNSALDARLLAFLLTH